MGKTENPPMTDAEKIAHAWARTLKMDRDPETHLMVYRARADYDGTTYIPVQSQRAGHPEHCVRVVRGRPQCDCEAMAYGRVPVCVHILTICLRAMKAKKFGTRGLARTISTLYGIPLDMTV